MSRVGSSSLRTGNGLKFQGRERDAPPHRPRIGEDSGDPEQYDTVSVKLAWASYKDREIEGSLVSSSVMLPLHRRSNVFSFRDAGKARKSKADIPSSSAPG